MKALGLFVVGVIVGYLAILFGWVAYTEFIPVADHDGGTAVAIGFFVAPLGALVFGIILAIAFGRKRRARP